MKKIYIIGIGGIGISAIARYYNEHGYQVFGSDKTDSELINKLKEEGIDVIIGERTDFIDNTFEKVIYTEAIPENQSELRKAKELGIQVLTYPEAVAEIANDKKFITISGSHGKSTTTSLASLIFKNSEKKFTSIVGTLLKEFKGRNYFSTGDEEYFIIEACEYKRSFLNYKSDIAIITNIDLDHLDYYKDEEDYVSAFKELIDNIKPRGHVILNGLDKNSAKLIGQRNDVNYVVVNNDSFVYNGKVEKFPRIELQVPGEHIVYDARLVYILGTIVGIAEKTILDTFKNYTGVWRRMEILGQTKNSNIVISDYGHHPTEIKLTLKAIKNKYQNRQLLTIFQPHQYNRTIELLKDFVDSFKSTDYLIIPNIYESRDSKEDKEKMNTEILLEKINHPNKQNGNGLENTLKLLNEFDGKNKSNLIIVLMGAGDVDNLRYEIELRD